MKYCISIFCLPHEIDDLELTLNQMKKAFRYVDEENFILDITLALTGELTLWEHSKIPIDYFVHKYEKLRKSCDWITKKYFRIEQESQVLGCVSKRRKTWKEHQNVDYHIWLDTDIIFDERTLAYIDSSIQSLNKDYPHAVVSPEIVKVWDNTWDCLVNEQFLNEPLDYQKTNDPYLDCGIKGDIGIETINNTVKNQPSMKFAGGWFTCISKKLLDRITVPDSLGHYGLEDTFIMWGSDKLKLGQQFKIKNLVVCENYKYRDNKYLTNFIAGIDRREEFKNIAHKNFQKEYDSL